MLTSAAIGDALARVTTRLPEIRDRLNDTDSRLGDGDTGMTVVRLVECVHAACDRLPPDAGDALALCGRECARASGSSLASVVAMGLVAAGRAARGQDAIAGAGVGRLLAAAVEAIEKRSGAMPGDKTILDSLVAIQRAMELQGTATVLLETAVAAAQAALDEFRGHESRIGRARIYAEKSAGLDDPGMLAVLLVLEAAADPAG